MLSHEIASITWSTIGIDICYFEGRSLLITSDYYSNFRTVRKINNQNTNEISNLLLGIFETHGLPQIIVCDNGSQFRDNLSSSQKN